MQSFQRKCPYCGKEIDRYKVCDCEDAKNDPFEQMSTKELEDFAYEYPTFFLHQYIIMQSEMKRLIKKEAPDEKISPN